MNGLFDQYQTTSDEEIPHRFLRGKEFEGEGQILEVVGVEIIKGSKYSATRKEDWLCQKEILQEGETFVYSFIQDGEEKIFESKSATFFIAMRQANPKPKDIIKITRTGEKFETRYEVTKLDNNTSTSKEQKLEGLEF